jgi:nucleotidyltransferase/DNA polymerase involved in DNA repair
MVDDGAGRVLACSEPARAAGVRPGLTLRQAEALCPDAGVFEARPGATARLADRLAGALYDLAPTVEVRLDGRTWLDLEGVPDPRQAIAEARRRLRRAAGVEPRLGLAPGPFTALRAAALALPGRLVRVEDARSFLAPLPVATLGLDPERLERLELLGLRTLGQLTTLGPRRLESQLGPAGRDAARLARGEEPWPLQPWKPPQVTGAHRQLEPPVEDREALLFVARSLVSDLAAELGLRGAAARRVRVRLGIAGREEPELRESPVRHPLSSATELFGLVGGWLREWRPAGPVDALAVELPALEAAGRRQLRLWMGGDGSADEVDAALERLRERWGERMELRVVEGLPKSPIPARRAALEPADDSRRPAAAPLPPTGGRRP